MSADSKQNDQFDQSQTGATMGTIAGRRNDLREINVWLTQAGELRWWLSIVCISTLMGLKSSCCTPHAAKFSM